MKEFWGCDDFIPGLDLLTYISDTNYVVPVRGSIMLMCGCSANGYLC